MKTYFYTQNQDVSYNKIQSQSKPQEQCCSKVLSDDSRCSKDPTGISSEASSAVASQHIGGTKVSFKATEKQFTEKDVNFSVTLCGYANAKNNTRDLVDTRCLFEYGTSFGPGSKPKLRYNSNGDEKRNGESTLLIFPLKPKTDGLRGNDNASILISGRISSKVASKFVDILAEQGFLGKEKFYINSDNPWALFNHPKIKPFIVDNLNRAIKEVQEEQKRTVVDNDLSNKQKQSTTANTNSSSNANNANNPESNKITTALINISTPGNIQNSSNTRTVDDYTKYFINNNRQFTVLHHGYDDNGVIKDMTVLLIPSVKEKGNFITVTIDNKLLSFDDAKGLVNNLVKNKVASPNNPNFRNAIVEYLSDK